MSEAEILKKLADAVVACEPETARAAAEEALKEGVDPVLAINEGLVVGMGVIGVWIAMQIDWVFRIICFLIRWHSGKWQTKTLV